MELKHIGKRRLLIPGLAGLISLTACALLPSPTAQAGVAAAKPAVKITAAHLTETTLGSAGGKLDVKATVKHARSCQLSLAGKPAITVVYSHSPTTSCSGGNYSAKLTIGPNGAETTRVLNIKLTARNATSSASKTLVLSIKPRTVTIPVASTTTTTTTTTSIGTTTTTSVPLTTTTTTVAPAVTPLSISAPQDITYSDNWSGYDVTGGPFTGASGTFSVPSVQSTPDGGTTSEWVGVDGVDNSSLIQAGVTEGPDLNGAIITYAWWEILPAEDTPIETMTVNPGDSVTVTIWQVSGLTWEIALVDNTNGQTFSAQEPYTGPGDSAEWVLEAPTDGTTNQVLPLGPFTPAVNFSGLGAAGTVSNIDGIDMTQDNGKTISATPSSLTSSGFSVTYTGTSYQPLLHAVKQVGRTGPAGQEVPNGTSVGGPGIAPLYEG